jgi:hypothetical protein
MTVQKAFKQRVRARMTKTGERYAAARRQLLAPAGEESPAETPAAEAAPAEAARVDLGMSSEALARRTGKGWDEWLALLDAWGAAGRKHPEIASYLRDDLGVDGWWAQGITVGYERARGMRAFGQLTDGFSASASKTVAVPVERLYEAFVDPELRRRWLPDAELAISSATVKAVHAAWPHEGAPNARVDAGLTAKGPSKSSVAVQVRRLPDAAAAERTKAYWRERLAALAALLGS